MFGYGCILLIESGSGYIISSQKESLSCQEKRSLENFQNKNKYGHEG